jgi:alkylated DNA repair protein alkB family protein 8
MKQIEVRGRRAPGFRLLAGFISKPEDEVIARWCDEQVDWSKLRRGLLPPARDFDTYREMPDWGRGVADRLVELKVFSERPDHLHINRYEAGRGMHAHRDKESYGPAIVGLTIRSSRVLLLNVRRGLSRMRVLLLPGDLYVMEGDARYRWEHSIPEAKTDHFEGRAYDRRDGYSATWRSRPLSLEGSDRTG